jgi:DNA-directed RNA polymerase specialized sigma24 family protein
MEGVSRKHGATLEDSQDIASECLIKVYERGVAEGFECMSWNGKPNVFYLFTITRNETISRYRKAKRGPKLIEIDERLSIDDNQLPINNDDDGLLCELLEHLRNNLDRYHYNLARIVILKQVPIKKLSNETGLPKRKLYYAYARIKQEVKAFQPKEYHYNPIIEGQSGCDIKAYLKDLPSPEGRVR